jgi:hypothetical protein
MPALLSMVCATQARGDVRSLHVGEPRRVQWKSRRVREARQRTVARSPAEHEEK